jgi:hypothetical protein
MKEQFLGLKIKLKIIKILIKLQKYIIFPY